MMLLLLFLSFPLPIVSTFFSLYLLTYFLENPQLAPSQTTTLLLIFCIQFVQSLISIKHMSHYFKCIRSSTKTGSKSSSSSNTSREKSGTLTCVLLKPILYFDG